MNKEDEIIRQDYNRAVNMWNETYSKCKIVDLKGKSLSVEPMFDIVWIFLPASAKIF